MKPALEAFILSSLGIMIGSTMHSIYRDNKHEFKQLQSSYDSLSTKYNELNARCNYFIKEYTNCEGERTKNLTKEIQKIN